VSAFADPQHELEPAEVARRMRDDGWLVVDVREAYERDAGHIAGTRHIELERLASHAGEIPRDRPVVFQCRMGARSGLATQAFRAAGWDAYNLRGGIQAWVDVGLEIAPDDGHVADH
jgi:rhodanese-related sulfurtransferase